MLFNPSEDNTDLPKPAIIGIVIGVYLALERRCLIMSFSINAYICFHEMLLSCVEIRAKRATIHNFTYY